MLITQIFVQWLIQHPEFLKNNLYIGGDSYSGIPVPMIVQDIYYGSDIFPWKPTETSLNQSLQLHLIYLLFLLHWGVADSERGGSPRLNLNLQVYDLIYWNKYSDDSIPSDFCLFLYGLVIRAMCLGTQWLMHILIRIQEYHLHTGSHSFQIDSMRWLYSFPFNFFLWILSYGLKN